MKHRKLAFTAIALLFAGATAEARDFNKLLHGDYAFTGTSTCLNSPLGFNADLTPVFAGGPAPFIISNSISGVRRFNGDGTGSTRAVLHNINHPFTVPGSYPVFVVRGGASISDLHSDFTYEVTPDMTLIIASETLMGTITKGGSRVGQRVTATNLPRQVGKISERLHTINLVQEDMAVEQVVFETPTGHDVTPRICYRERVLLELKDRKERD
jgi:hypothetical protein